MATVMYAEAFIQFQRMYLHGVAKPQKLKLQHFFFFKDPIYLQSIIIHSANGGKGEGWHVEEYSVALLC
jgi:hypothetical protein